MYKELSEKLIFDVCNVQMQNVYVYCCRSMVFFGLFSKTLFFFVF